MSSAPPPLTPAQVDYAQQLGPLPEPVTVPETATPPRPATSPRQQRRAERLHTLRYWFLEGMTVAQAEAAAVRYWKVRPRTAREYLRQVKQSCAHESSGEDYLAQLWLAKLQREHLADKALRKLGTCEDVKAWMALLRVCQQLLKERDQLLARIHDHRVRTRRDTSPDSQAARRHRQGQITLTAEEWEARLTHWRNVLFQEWTTTRQAEQGKVSDSLHGVPEQSRDDRGDLLR